MPNNAKTLGLPALAAAAFLLFSAGSATASGQIPLCPPPDLVLTPAQRSALVKTAAQCRTAFNESDASADCVLGYVEGHAAPYAECAQCTSIRITCTYTAHGKEKKFGINGYRASTDTLEDLTRQGIRTSPAQKFSGAGSARPGLRRARGKQVERPTGNEEALPMAGNPEPRRAARGLATAAGAALALALAAGAANADPILESAAVADGVTIPMSPAARTRGRVGSASRIDHGRRQDRYARHLVKVENRW